MERYIYNNVFKVVEPIINTNQHGYMNGKSCTTQVLTVYDEIGKHIDEGKETDILFLIFFKSIRFSGSQYVNSQITQAWYWMVSLLSLCQLHLVCDKDPYLFHYYFYFL